MPSTPVYAFPYPVSTDPADVPADMQRLAAQVETTVGALNAAGPYLSRPTAASAKAGGLYFATDTLGTFRSTGSAWVLIGQGAPLITNAVMNAAPFTSPYDGQEVNLQVDAANGVNWRFRYNAASASAYKWEFVGGSELVVVVGGGESTTGGVGSYVNLATVGPSIVVPRAGDYLAFAAASMQSTTAQLYLQIGLGVGDFSSAPITFICGAAPNNWANVSGMALMGAMGSGAEIRMKYLQQAAGTMVAQNRWLFVHPRRVS